MKDDSEIQSLIQEATQEIERLLLSDRISEEQKCFMLRKIIKDHKDEISK